MNKKTYRGVIFDLDGTLTDPMQGITRSVTARCSIHPKASLRACVTR